MRRLAFAVLLVLGCSSRQPAPASGATPVTSGHAATDLKGSDARRSSIVEDVLREWHNETRCPISSAAGEFDDFPHGDLRSFWCHRPAGASLALLRTLSGTNVFTAGPHKDDLRLDAPDFGRYDRRFVRWLTASVPQRDSAARVATQAAYDAKLSPLAEAYWQTLQKIIREPECFEKEHRAYRKQLEQKALPKDYHARWFFFMNPWFCEKGDAKDFYYENAFDGGIPGKVVTSVFGFWVRRATDMSFDDFADGLRRFLVAYEPELVNTPSRPPDRASIERALEGGIKAAAACKDPSAPIDKLYVAITMRHDGGVEAWIKSPAVKGTKQETCIERAFAAQKITPFDGKSLPFTRTLPLK